MGNGAFLVELKEWKVNQRILENPAMISILRGCNISCGRIMEGMVAFEGVVDNVVVHCRIKGVACIKQVSRIKGVCGIKWIGRIKGVGRYVGVADS